MSESIHQTKPQTMVALTQSRYGAPEAVLSLQTVPVPEIGSDDVLVAVEASSINPADWHGVRGEPLIARVVLGLRTPSAVCPGCDVAGVVAQVGRNVEGIKVGDRVVGYTPEKHRGGFAPLAAVPMTNIALIPDGVDVPAAACLPLAGATALHALRDHAKIESGQRVMIVGASGGVGSLALQIAKHYGAEVTGVCSSRNVAWVQDLGADAVIDYTTTEYVVAPDGTDGYDAIIQVGGSMPASRLRRALTPTGHLVLVSGDGGGRWFGPIGRIVRGVAMSAFGRGRVITMNAVPTSEDLEFLVSLVSDGSLHVNIDKTVPLAAVPEAIGELETGHTRGKISVAI